MKIKTIVLITLFGLPLLFNFFLPKEAKADTVIVNASVASKVSAEKSEVFTNVSEILADLSQRVILTVRTRDQDGNLLPNIKVEVNSNRGEVDQIKAVKASGGILSAAEEAQSNITTTDEDGVAIFRISSTVPGEATFTVIADNVVELRSVKVKFLPLPFPTDITVSIEVPSFINPEKKIILFYPAESHIDKTKLINTGTEIKIPFSLFSFIVVVILLTPSLFFMVMLLFKKIRETELKEAEYLQKEAEFIKREKELVEKIAQKEQIQK